jgi:CubicO group peptidase (beta-lactamase class C family)
MRVSIVLLLLAGCAEKLSFDTPIPVDDTFETATPTPEALARYERASVYSAEHAGVSFIVLEGDAVVFARAHGEHTLEEPRHLFSGTKSFSCALAQVAVADGLLDLDERVALTLTEWDGVPDKTDVTVRQILHLTSGLEQSFWKLSRDGMLLEQKVVDKYALAVDLEVATTPGSTYEYGSSEFMVFGELMKRKLGSDPLDYLDERVLQPIGMRTAGWHRDPSGNPMLPYGAWTTAHEWAKFGVLARDDGMWQGERLVAQGAFAECWQGSDANPAYGLTWWLNRATDADIPVSVPAGQTLMGDAPEDAVVAAGHDDQRLYVVPSRDVVVVRLSEGDRQFDDAEFLALVLGP